MPAKASVEVRHAHVREPRELLRRPVQLRVKAHLLRCFPQCLGRGKQGTGCIARLSCGTQQREQFTEQAKQSDLSAGFTGFQLGEQTPEPEFCHRRCHVKNRIGLDPQSRFELCESWTVESQPVQFPGRIRRGTMRMRSFVAQPCQTPRFELPTATLLLNPASPATAIEQVLAGTPRAPHLLPRRCPPPACPQH